MLTESTYKAVNVQIAGTQRFSALFHITVGLILCFVIAVPAMLLSWAAKYFGSFGTDPTVIALLKGAQVSIFSVDILLLAAFLFRGALLSRGAPRRERP